MLLAGAFLIAAALLVAGVLEWRVTATGTHCPGIFCGIKPDQHVLIYPHRAEGLWVLSAMFALGSLALAIAPRGGGGRSPASAAVRGPL
jgi:hypothetical protein